MTNKNARFEFFPESDVFIKKFTRVFSMNCFHFPYGEISRRRAMIGGSFSNVNWTSSIVL